MDEPDLLPMRALGVDVGTTTVSAALVEDGRVAETATLPNDSWLPADAPRARIQDAGRIETLARTLIDRFRPARPDVIGLTGQMHGIVYANARGEAVSPLYTWQDARAESLAAELSRETGEKLAAGYGLVTHAYLTRTNALPHAARKLTTIDSYLAMRLTNTTTPLIHPSDAASLGFFDARTLRFTQSDPMLPELAAKARIVGETADGIPVALPLGDNQASFLGCADEAEGAVLVNLGTGGQISIHAPSYTEMPPCETRPYIDGTYLLVGSLLCGGRAYALMEGFLRACAELAGAKPDNLYEAMNRLAETEPDDPVIFRPFFEGAREKTDLRASVENLTAANFTPAHLISGLLDGLANALRDYYGALPPPKRLCASGNAIRKNPALQRKLARAFGCSLTMPDAMEEAATGAAKFALAAMR